jgi:hypothetical protein
MRGRKEWQEPGPILLPSSDASWQEEDYTHLDTEDKASVLERLVQKAAHARHGVEWKIYKELTVKRKGANYVGNVHRGRLKAISTGSEIRTLPKGVLKKRGSKM